MSTNIQDLSSGVIQVARLLERLYPGRYNIIIIRPRKGEEWLVEVFAEAKISDRVFKDMPQKSTKEILLQTTEEISK